MSAPPPAPPRDVQLDGLRGLAILLVLFYHATEFARAPGVASRVALSLPAMGWSGVDLFFVLSGFLITRLLLRDRGSPGYFRRFYARRVLRILPLYFTVLAVFLVLVPRLEIFAGTSQFWLRGAERESWWYWLFLSNVHVFLTGRFHHHPLSLTWSLAIEEQFYLVWPIVVQRVSPRALLRVCEVAIVGAFALRVIATWSGGSPLGLYVFTPFRLDTLAVGAWIALRAHADGGFARLGPRARSLLPWLSLVWGAWVVAYGVWPGLWSPQRNLTLLAHPLSQTLGYSVLALLYGTLLVALMDARPGGRARRAFESAPLVELGKVSFALYLLHVPAVIVTNALVSPLTADQPFWTAQLLRWASVFSLAYAAAWLSWQLLESRALALRHRVRFET